MNALKVSRDRKVSPFSVWRTAAKRWEPAVANSFGLPAGPPSTGGSCTGVTPFCDGCYASGIERHFTSVDRLVRHNHATLVECGANVRAMVDLLRPLVESFLVECGKAEKKIGAPVERVYRIHWDGDFYSRPYAAAWVRVMGEFPQVQFWAYTRSFDVVDILSAAGNLSLYLSVDADNVVKARATKKRFPTTKLAFCAETWEGTESLAARFPKESRGPRCPELTGKVPMVNAEGVGACVTCTLCTHGKNNVRFAIKH
jgi:hypothetical protein